MEWLFGKRMSPDEMMRKNQRALNKAMRDLDREKMKMEQQEKKIIADIKKLAKENQMDAVKIMAKDLVRTRRYVRKFMLMKANIQAVSLKIQTLKSQNAMGEAMKGVTKAMTNMNRQLNMPQIQKILHEFEKQSEIMDMKEEMINDAMDDAMEDEGDEEETDAIVSQVLDELGLQLNDQLSGLPQVSARPKWFHYLRGLRSKPCMHCILAGVRFVGRVRSESSTGGSSGSGWWFRWSWISRVGRRCRSTGTIGQSQTRVTVFSGWHERSWVTSQVSATRSSRYDHVAGWLIYAPVCCKSLRTIILFELVLFSFKS